MHGLRQPRVVIGAKRHRARKRRRIWSRIDPCSDQLPLPHECQSVSASVPSFQLNRARRSRAAGITARGIGRVKNVTSAATMLMAPSFRGNDV
jgi:hypothetical protein